MSSYDNEKTEKYFSGLEKRARVNRASVGMGAPRPGVVCSPTGAPVSPLGGKHPPTAPEVRLSMNTKTEASQCDSWIFFPQEFCYLGHPDLNECGELVPYV